MKDLIERLRDDSARHDDEARRVCNKAADMLEQQAAEIETEIELRRKAEQGLVDWRVKYTELQSKLSAMEKQEPAEYRSRMRPLWGLREFTNWVKCTKEQYDDYKRTPILHDWEYEAQKLYTAPKVAQPLSDEQFNNLVMEHLGPHALTGGKMSVYDAFLKAVRATERAHNIGGQQP